MGKLRLCVLALAIAAAYLTLSAAPAFGALTHPLKGTFGTVSEPGGIAVEEASGNVFVTDRGSPGNSVQIFGPEGGAPSGVAASKIEGFDFPSSRSAGAVAIDNSPTSPSRGALYVADRDDVKKFTLNPLSEEYELTGTLNGSPALEQPQGIAVDADGNVFVTDQHDLFTGSIVEFDPVGNQIARFEVTESSVIKDALSRLDFDSAGNLYVLTFLSNGFWKFAANGVGEVELGTTTPSELPDSGANDIAIDRATDTLYAATGSRIEQYDVTCLPGCAAEREFGFGILQRPSAIGVSPIDGGIYVGDAGAHNVAHFGAGLAVVPDAFTEGTSAVTQVSATLHGAVSADGGPSAECEFQYTTKASFEAGNFAGATTAPCSPAGPFTGSAKEAVKAEISGLAAETTYRYRLRAFNENGPGFGQTLSFVTVGKPKIAASEIAKVTTTGATVEGLVNPNGGPGAAEDTVFFVEYVSSADFDADEYAKAISLPLGGEAIGSGTADVKVAQQFSGLAVGSSYHFRIVAENEAGQTIGPDQVFATFIEQPAGLPDGRVYEQVTPVQKNGAAPTFNPGRFQATKEGEGIAYLSNGGFPGTEGGQGFPTFFATRGTDWSSQGVLPPGSLGALGGVLGWSEDLSHAYLVQGALPGDELNLLERDSPGGALRTLATEGSTSQSSAYYYVDSAQDGSTVFFESEDTPKTTKAPAVFNTYVWDRASGELSLAGILPGGGVAAKGSPAGSNEAGLHGQILQDEHAVSSDGSSLFFHDDGTGQLYLRHNPAAEEEECADPQAACTVQVSKSQRTPVDPLDPEGKKPARFWQATPDGSLAFFSSAAKLTDDATTGPDDEGNDLYRYDAESGELLDLTPDPDDPAGASVQGVLGASEDGSRVYFAADGVLAAGATPGDCAGVVGNANSSGNCNLYLWHDGTTTFLAPLAVNNGVTTDSANWITVGAGGGKTSRLSTDGETLLFRSQEKLTAYDNQRVPVFYRYSASDGEILCVSCNPTGTAPSKALATLQSVPSGLGNVPPASVLSRNLSANGTRVFFETADKLVAADTNGDQECALLGQQQISLRTCQDVYEWEAKGSGSCQSEAQNGGCLYLISDGRASQPAFFADADAAGENAFLLTDRPLVGQDKDQIRDIYDAHVGGGIASQNPPAPPPPCAAGESCRGALAPTPAPGSPATSTFSGPGNQKASQHKKHKKKSHRKKKHKQRHATRKHG